MPRRANTQTQQEAVQENAAVQANAGADMQMEATITKTQPEKGVLALADVKIGDFTGYDHCNGIAALPSIQAGIGKNSSGQHGSYCRGYRGPVRCRPAGYPADYKRGKLQRGPAV